MIGRFIVLEGVDGAGTTTQAERLGRALAERGVAVHVTREPSGGPVGTLIRELLKGGLKAVDQRAMALLFAADRMDHLQREIVPQLDAGTHVLCDRYVLSSEVYQSRFVEAEFVRTVNAKARPADLTLYLDVDAETAQARRKGRGGASEMYERLALQRRFVEHYRSGIPEDILRREHVDRIDGTQAIDEVFAACLRAIESCLAAGTGSSSK